MKYKQMKLIALVFAVCLVVSPAVRYSTAQVLHTVANFIEPES